MNYTTLIPSILASLDPPVAHLTYGGSKPTYFTFFRYNKLGRDWAEDAELQTGHYIQLDCWSKSDCSGIADQAEALMVAAGFFRIGSDSGYEKDTKTYHEMRDFLYEEERGLPD